MIVVTGLFEVAANDEIVVEMKADNAAGITLVNNDADVQGFALEIEKLE